MIRTPLILSCLPLVMGVATPHAISGEPNPLAFAAPAGAPSVLTDVGGDGAVYALGSTYKLQVDDAGATFFPRVGLRAPRSPQLDLSLTRATIGGAPLQFAATAAPSLSGDTVTVHRGAIIEQYSLGSDLVEQSFLIPKPLRGGDLEIWLGDQSEARYVARDQAGLRFDAAGFGAVHYGDAVVVDDAGRQWQVESAFERGAIVLRVPGEIIQAARYPLLIDPPVTFLSVDTDGDDDEDPDVAYDTLQNKYLVVYEKVVSASDRDIVSRRFDAAGTFLDEVAVDLSGADTVDPAVASEPGDFLVVWNALNATLLNDNIIRGRTRQAGNTNQGAAFDISTGSNNEQHPDVGGSPNPVASPFLVVWDEDPVIGLRNVKGRQVSVAGAVGPEIAVVATDNDESNPVISKNAGASGRWMVLWEQVDQGSSKNFLGGRALRDNGTFVQTVFNLDGHDPAAPFFADVAGDGDQWMAVYEMPDTNNASRKDVIATNFAISPQGSLNSVERTNVSKVAIGATEQVDQLAPAVAAEGCRFLVSYLRQTAGTAKFDVHTTILALKPGLFPGSVQVIEGDDKITGGDLSNHRDLVACSTSFDEPGRNLVLWTRQVSGASDNIEGAFLSTLQPGGVSTIQTGCGSPEPALLTTAVPAIGETFGFLMLGFSTPNPLLFVGTLQATPVPFCPGQGGCALGVHPQLVFNVPTLVQGAIPCDPALIGFQVGIQGIDVLPPSDPGVACGPPVFPQKFRVSDTLVLKFQ